MRSDQKKRKIAPIGDKIIRKKKVQKNNNNDWRRCITISIITDLKIFRIINNEI